MIPTSFRKHPLPHGAPSPTRYTLSPGSLDSLRDRRCRRQSKDQFIPVLLIGGAQTGALQDVGQLLLLGPWPLHQLQLFQLALCLGRSLGEGVLREGGWHGGLWGSRGHVPCPSGPSSVIRQTPALCRRKRDPSVLPRGSCTPEAGKRGAELHPRLGVSLNGLLQLGSTGKGREGRTRGRKDDDKAGAVEKWTIKGKGMGKIWRGRDESKREDRKRKKEA